MSGSRLYRVSAVVLRQRNLGEADRIVTLYTRERGKLSGVAKGVKKPRSKLAPCLQLFTHAGILLASARSLDVIAQVQPVDLFPHLREGMGAYGSASYVCEVVDVFSEEGASDPAVFALLVATLSALDAGADAATIVLGFEVKLLAGLGYGPELRTCVCCGAEVKGAGAGFSAAQGGVMCAGCRRKEGAAALSPAGWQALRELLATPQETLAGRRLAAKVRQELRALMRAYVDYRSERQLRSAAFLSP